MKPRPCSVRCQITRSRSSCEGRIKKTGWQPDTGLRYGPPVSGCISIGVLQGRHPIWLRRSRTERVRSRLENVVVVRGAYKQHRIHFGHNKPELNDTMDRVMRSLFGDLYPELAEREYRLAPAEIAKPDQTETNPAKRALRTHERKPETKHKNWPWLAYAVCFLVGIAAIGEALIDFAMNRHPWLIVCIVMRLVWLEIRRT
jgi:hypothetical protein